jgi:hypothetical protein
LISTSEATQELLREELAAADFCVLSQEMIFLNQQGLLMDK